MCDSRHASDDKQAQTVERFYVGQTTRVKMLCGKRMTIKHVDNIMPTCEDCQRVLASRFEARAEVKDGK